MNLREALQTIGFFRTQERFPELVKRARQMVIDAGDDSARTRFEKLPSFIPADPATKFSASQILIDIGGTSTKVGIRIRPGKDADHQWRVLFEEPNEEFNLRSGSGTSLERFAMAVAERTGRDLSALKISSVAPWALGIVWSNAMINRRTPEGSIAGTIVHRARYTKNEWFNADTKDGDPVSQPFETAFQRAGIKTGVSLVSNDTPLTMKALALSHAGMVASTGVNATLVETIGGRRIICNAEMGTTFVLSPEFISEGDSIGPGVPCRVIEHQLSGKFLPQIFSGHVMALGARGVAEFSALAEYLKSRGPDAYDFFQAEALSDLLVSPERFLARYESAPGLSQSIVPLLGELHHNIVERSAQLAALLAFASVSNQVEIGSQLVIALDSRLSREMPLFWRTMQATLASLLPRGSSVRLSLVDRKAVEGGVLSVPMLGAANALDALA